MPDSFLHAATALGARTCRRWVTWRFFWFGGDCAAWSGWQYPGPEKEAQRGQIRKELEGRRDRPGIADSTCLHASSRLRRRRSGQSVHGEPRVARDTYSKTWRPTYHEPRAILSERHIWLPDFPDLAGHCESPFLGSNGQLAWLPTGGGEFAGGLMVLVGTQLA